MADPIPSLTRHQNHGNYQEAYHEIKTPEGPDLEVFVCLECHWITAKCTHGHSEWKHLPGQPEGHLDETGELCTGCLLECPFCKIDGT